MSKETGFLKGVYFSAEILSGIYSKQKKHKEALSFYTEFKQVSDSMFSVEKNQTIEQLNTKIKIDKKTYTLELKHAKQKNLLIFICLILVALIMGIVLYFLRLRKRNKRKYEYRIKERETEAEKQLLLNIYEERRRISRDIHDDLGSSISGIKILSEILFDKTTDPELKQGHQKLLEMQSEVTEKVRDIIWMLNQENNTLEKLMWYCSNYAQKVMNSFGVTVNTINNTAIPPIEIDETTRKNFFLCVKEALNNILKHAKASEIQVEFEYENETFKIEIRDNGKGFNVLTSGEFTNGVSNMKCRMETVDGHFKIRSTTKGTNVILEKNIPLNRD